MVTLTSDDIRDLNLTDMNNSMIFGDYDYYPCDRCGNLFNETNLGAFPASALWCQNCRPGADKWLKRKETFENRTLSGQCEFYPWPIEETAVCDAGSDISGGPACTEKDSKTCPWAKERREK